MPKHLFADRNDLVQALLLVGEVRVALRFSRRIGMANVREQIVLHVVVSDPVSWTTRRPKLGRL